MHVQAPMMRSLITFGAICLLAPLAHADWFDWKGGPWNDPNSWASDAPGIPGPGDTAYFRGSTSGPGTPVDLGAGAVVGSIYSVRELEPYQNGNQTFGTGPVGSQNLAFLDTINFFNSWVSANMGFTFNCNVFLGNSAGAGNYKLNFHGAETGYMIFNAPVNGGSSGTAGVKNLLVTNQSFSPGKVYFNAGLGDGGSDKLNVAVQYNNSITFNAAATYSGTTTISYLGRIYLEVANALSQLSDITVDEGFLDAKADQQLGSLSVADSNVYSHLPGCTLTFSGMGIDIAFADSHTNIWTGVLALNDFQIGEDTLRFGTDATGLTLAQLAAISLPGYNAGIDENGYVTFTAIPEPTSIALALGGIGMLFVLRRREMKSPR